MFSCLVHRTWLCLFSLLGLGWLWGAVLFVFFFLLEGLRRNYCFLFHCGNWGWSLGWVFRCHFGAVSSLHARSFAWGWCLWPVGCGGKGALFATSVSASLKTFLIDTFLKVFWGIFSQIKVLKTKKKSHFILTAGDPFHSPETFYDYSQLPWFPQVVCPTWLCQSPGLLVLRVPGSVLWLTLPFTSMRSSGWVPPLQHSAPKVQVVFNGQKSSAWARFIKRKQRGKFGLTDLRALSAKKKNPKQVHLM